MRLWHPQIKIKTPSLAGRTTKRFQSPAFKHHPPEKICVSLIHEVSFTFVFHEELNRVKLHTTQWSVPKLLGEPLTRWVWNYGIGVFNTDVVTRLRELIKVLKHTGDVDMSIFSYKPWVRKFLWREVIHHWLNKHRNDSVVVIFSVRRPLESFLFWKRANALEFLCGGQLTSLEILLPPSPPPRWPTNTAVSLETCALSHWLVKTWFYRDLGHWLPRLYKIKFKRSDRVLQQGHRKAIDDDPPGQSSRSGRKLLRRRSHDRQNRPSRG